MKKRISLAFCVIAAAALISVGAVAQQARKVTQTTGQSSFMTEQVKPTVRGAVEFPTVKRSSGKMGLRQAQPTSSRLTMPTVSTTSTMDAIRQATGIVNFAGCVIFSENQARKNKAVYELSSEGGIGNKLSTAISGDMIAGYGACVIDNTYYSMGAMDLLGTKYFFLDSYDMNNGFAELSSKSIQASQVTQVLLYDGAKVYGSFVTATQGEYIFGTIDLNTAEITTIATVDYLLVAGAVDAEGNLYGIIEGDTDAYLAKINKTNGEKTKVGNGLGVLPKYLSGAVIDPKSGRMFYNVCPADETGNLYEINLTTGAATKLVQYPDGEEISGMYVPFSPEPGAPAAPEQLTLSFPNGTLTGTVSFRTPTTTQGGTTGTGSITYKLLENGTQIATASVNYGQQVQVPVTVSAAGNYTYAVELSNAAGSSYQIKASMYIGKDMPKSPAPVTAEWADGTMTVSWPAVTESANGGYIDLSKLTYNVTCGDRVVKDNFTGTTFTEPITENGTYVYKVVAVCDGVSSEAAVSNNVIVGTRSLPAEFRFITSEQFEEFTVIDANNDGETWTHYKAAKRAQCSWHSKNTMDDWLIAPPLELKAGKAYRVSAIIFNNSENYEERYEVKIGKGTTVADMTTTLIPPSVVSTKDTIPVESNFSPTTDGRYHVGIHGISDPRQYNLYVVSIRVEEIDGRLPASATDLVVTPDMSGLLSAKIDFKNPAKALDGSNLTSLSKVEVIRDNVVVKEFANPAPGAALTFTDNTIPSSDDYTYKVVVYNNIGASSPVATTVYVGFDVPTPPTNVNMTEVSNGRVKITWTAPAADINGKPLNASDITYEIRDASTGYPLIASVGSVNEYEFDALEPGECDFLQFVVFPVTNAGRGDGNMTPFICAGTPIPTPYLEGFDPLTYNLGMEKVSGSGSWGVMGVNESIPETPDGDQKFIAFKAGAQNAASIIYTLKVDLTNVENPTFAFYTYNITSDAADPAKNNLNEVTVVAREANAAEWTVVKPAATVHDLCGGQADIWGRVTADLSAFKGKVVQLGVQAKAVTYTYTALDKWSVMTAYDDNLSADAITVPTSVMAGKEVSVTVKVSNQGKNAAASYSVELYDMSSEGPIATAAMANLASYADTVVEFKPVFAPGQAGDHTLYAKVVYPADKYMGDNATDGVVVKVNVSQQAVPSGLNAALDAANQEHINLTWNAATPASTQRMATAITDNVESYAPWKYDGAGDWKFVDKDGKKSGGFEGTNIPGLTPGETVSSFFTFSKTGIGGNESFAAHSGDKYFASMFLIDGSMADDWLISPELSGTAQTISFWARSYSSTFAEKIGVYTSTGSDNPDDFTEVAGSVVASVPREWTMYEVQLPAGAKRFAIRSFAADAFMLMVDDITYIPADVTPAVLVGYNVYRDNVKINTEVIPAGTTMYKDTDTKAETKYMYYVTAVYDNGEESAASNSVTITSSVPGLSMSDVTIDVVNNTIVVEKATETVTVTDMAGVVLFRGLNTRVAVTVSKGAYIVSTGKLTRKVMVK